MSFHRKNKVVLISCVALIITGIIYIVIQFSNVLHLLAFYRKYLLIVFNSCLCLILVGAGYILLQFDHNKKARAFLVALSFLLIIICGLTLLGYLFHFNAGIDKLLVTGGYLNPIAYPLIHTQMLPGTAVVYLCLGMALIGFSTKIRFVHILSQYLLHVVSVFCLILLIGFAYNGISVIKMERYAMNYLWLGGWIGTLSVAASFLHPSLGLTSMFSGTLVGNKMARRLFLMMTASILVFGLVKVNYLAFSVWEFDSATSLFVACILVAGLLIIWHTANWLNKVDLRRIKAEEELKVLNGELEIRVQERSLEIQKKEERYRSVLENASDAIYLVDNGGHFVDANNSMCKMTGYSKEELLQLRVEDVYDKEQLKTDPVNLSLVPSQSIFKQRTFIRKDGAMVEVEINGKRLDEDKLMGVARDVTERKRMEMVAREAEMKFRTLVEKSILGVYITQNKKFLYVNPRFAEIFGYTCPELMDLSTGIIETIYAEESRPMIREKIWARDAGESESAHYEAVGLKKDGARIRVEFYGNRVTINGQLATIGTMLDITERKQAEESLRESEARFRGAFENASIGVALVSLTGEWLQVNGTLCEMLGYSENELFQLTFQQITHTGDLGSDLEFLSQTIKGEIDNYNVEKRYVHKNGSIVWANLNVSAIRDQNKQLLYFLSVVENITEKVESQRKFQSLVENFIVGVYILQNNKLVYINPRVVEETGYSEDEIINMPYDKFIYPDDREMVMETVNLRITERIQTVRYEARILHKEGHPIWYEILGGATEYRGAPALIGTMVDITERKAAEKEIHRLTRLYQFISSINESMLKAGKTEQVYADACRIAVEIGGFQMAWIGIYDQKNDCTIQATWSGHEDGFFTKINLAGMKVSESAVPSARSIRERTNIYYNDIANDPNIPSDIKHEMIKRSYLSAVSFPIFVGGKIVAAMVLHMSEPFFFNEEEIELLHDVTNNITYALDKIRILELQDQSEANLRSIFDSTDVSYLLLDTEYNIISLNQQMRDVYKDNVGITLREGGNLIDVIVPERKQSARAIYDNVLQTKKPGSYEASFTNNGFTKHFAASVFPITVGNESIGICITTIDITQQKNALEKLKETNESLQKHAKQLAISNAELEQFAFVASHDLQEPLRMVTSFMTLLEKNYSNVIDDKGRHYINFAVGGAKRMRQLILDLLNFSRVGNTEDDMELVNFNKLLTEILALYRKQIEELKADIHIGNLPALQTFKAPARQVFHNLVGNSLKYHKAGRPPVIHISCEETNTHFQFSVKDNGIGIAPEYFEKIFIIFQRLHNKDEYSGTGMGLAIAKKITETLGGKIWLESEEGKGSIFYFTLPKNN